MNTSTSTTPLVKAKSLFNMVSNEDIIHKVTTYKKICRLFSRIEILLNEANANLDAIGTNSADFSALRTQRIAEKIVDTAQKRKLVCN